VWDSGLSKGKCQVLSLKELEKIHQTAMPILDEVGVQGALLAGILACRLQGRERWPGKVAPVLSGKALEGVYFQAIFCGRGESPLPDLGKWRVYLGTGEAVSNTLDLGGGECSLSLGN